MRIVAWAGSMVPDLAGRAAGALLAVRRCRLGLPIALGVLAVAGCSTPAERPAGSSGDSAPQPTSGAAASTPAPRTIADTLCTPPARGFRMGDDSVGDFPSRDSISALRRRCVRGAIVSLDQSPFPMTAVQFPFAGGDTVWAMPDYDTTAPPVNWRASGDHVATADGRAIPRTFAAIRAAFPRAIVGIDHADDSNGTEIFVCGLPRLTIVMGWGAASGADSDGIFPIARAPVPDTSRYQFVALYAGDEPRIVNGNREWLAVRCGRLYGDSAR